MITPKDKDRILTYISISDEHYLYIDYNDVFPAKEVSFNNFRLILEQFGRFGLLSEVAHCTGHKTRIRATADLYDFYNHGGFVAQEELLRANIEKFNGELVKLSKEIDPSNIPLIDNITRIAASITTALGIFSD